MSENVAKVGQRIRAIREQRGWSQGELAARLGRTQTAISYWEAGRRALGVDDLVELAEALDVPTSELLPAGSSRPVPALLRAIAEQVDAGKLADDLEEFALAAQQLPYPDPRWEITPASPRDTAEVLLAAAKIIRPPVPVEDLAIGCGVQILPWDFTDIDGLVVELDAGVVIWVNDKQAVTRQRFTLAHELGHHLLRHADQFHLDFGGELSPGATGERPGYNWRAERAANDFAASLLMPASMVTREFARTSDVRTLASRFDVSAAAMSFRLINLRLQT